MKNNIKTGNWFIDQLNLYQSANSDYKSVKNNFIIRQNEYSTIIDSLLNKKAGDPLQHELILGRRGSGKSTLLKRIEIEIIENQKLYKKYLPINPAEEQAGIYRLFDLWEQVLEEMKHRLVIDFELKEFSSFDTNDDYTRYLYQKINELCKQHKKQIILLLDNFDRIVENFGDDGNMLRETLINYNDIEIVAGSTRMDEHFWRYDMPFYEFFRRHRLEALSREEIFTLLDHWSETLHLPELKDYVSKNPGKIENIRILTDGLPRTLQFFIQMVLQNTESNSYDYLKKIMDNVTPLYQERLNSLTPSFRKTVLEMAFLWEACTTKQLVEKVKMESKLVSANLKSLVDKGIVDKIETNKKNHLYRISERFFNMWLIITQGNPEQKRKAKWLSVFLENWYDAVDFKELTKIHIENLKNGNTNWDKALIFSKGLCQSKFISVDDRDTIIQLTDDIKEKNINNCMIELPVKFNVVFKEFVALMGNDQYEKALQLISGIENEEDGIKFNLMGVVYEKLNDKIKSEKSYLLSIEKKCKEALFNLALLYADLDKIVEAEEYYQRASDAGIASAMFNLGNLYFNKSKNDLAEKYFLMAIKNDVVPAKNNLALLYFNQDKFDAAESLYLSAIDEGDTNALFNLAILYRTQKKYDKAEKYYLLAYEKGEERALDNIALMYENNEQFDKSVKYYLLSAKKGFFQSYDNLAIYYHEQNKYTEAEKYYRLGIKNNVINSYNNLAYLLYEKNIKSQESLDLITKSCDLERDSLYEQTKIIIEIWNGIFNNVENRIESHIKENGSDKLNLFLLDLLIQQQNNLVLQLFENKDFGKILQEKYAVLYYVTHLLSHNREENLELRIPPELQSTIDEVMTEIEEREKLYGYK